MVSAFKSIRPNTNPVVYLSPLRAILCCLNVFLHTVSPHLNLGLLKEVLYGTLFQSPAEPKILTYAKYMAHNISPPLLAISLTISLAFGICFVAPLIGLTTKNWVIYFSQNFLIEYR